MTPITSLPIEAIKTKFCQTLSENNTVILSAPPGAGKSTCLPLWLLDLAVLGDKKIYLLQPRRLAVKNIAAYLALQLSEAVGQTVGYRLRNESNEFHERSLQGDLAFALSRDIQQGLRDDLKILLMSATLDVEVLTKALPDAISLASEGKCYPVDIIYDSPVNTRRWREHALSVIKKNAHQHQGSMLVFLPVSLQLLIISCFRISESG